MHDQKLETFINLGSVNLLLTLGHFKFMFLTPFWFPAGLFPAKVAGGVRRRPGVNVTKLFFFVTDEVANWAGAMIPGKHFQPFMKFVSKARAWPSVVAISRNGSDATRIFFYGHVISIPGNGEHPLTRNYQTVLECFAGEIHSSLFGFFIGDEEKKSFITFSTDGRGGNLELADVTGSFRDPWRNRGGPKP